MLPLPITGILDPLALNTIAHYVHKIQLCLSCSMIVRRDLGANVMNRKNCSLRQVKSIHSLHVLKSVRSLMFWSTVAAGYTMSVNPSSTIQVSHDYGFISNCAERLIATRKQ